MCLGWVGRAAQIVDLGEMAIATETTIAEQNVARWSDVVCDLHDSPPRRVVYCKRVQP